MRPLRLLTVAVTTVFSAVQCQKGRSDAVLAIGPVLTLTSLRSTLDSTRPLPSNLLSQRDDSFTCTETASGEFAVTIVNASSDATTSDRHKRQDGNLLIITLSESIMKDQPGRTFYIAANHQLLFDSPPPPSAIDTSGFSLCSNGSLTHRLSALWYSCVDGEFSNIYDRPISNDSCSQIHFNAVGDVQPIIGNATTSLSAPSPPSTSSQTSFRTSSPSSTSSPRPATSPSSSSPPPTSSLSPGEKVAIGVAVPLGVIATVGILFLIYRRHRKPNATLRSGNSPDDDFDKKPELIGGPYDPTIAGPVRRKPELHAKSRQISELAQDDSHELPVTKGNATSTELLGAPTDATRDEALAVRPISKISRKPVPVPAQRSTAGLRASKPQKTENHDELTEEYDTLVSEMGIISKRKKALTAAAATAGVEPEDLRGRRGEDYSELMRREEKLRGRMTELQDALKIGEE